MPWPIIKAFGLLKKCSAIVNMKYKLEKTMGEAII